MTDAATDPTARRRELSAAFLDSAGWGAAARGTLAGDASNRRYDRLRDPKKGAAVLMDAPPERGEDVGPFVAVTEHLRGCGFSAPTVVAADFENGFLLLEDLGDDLYARLFATGHAEETPLYEAAVDAIIALGQTPPPRHLDGWGQRYELPPYDMDALWREAALAVNWWAPGAAPSDACEDSVISSEIRTAYADAVRTVCADVATARDCLVLRDYHAENLIWLPARNGLARVGLLDYQDALIGHPGYDLVSLLEDARRDVAPDLAEAMTRRYVERSEASDPVAFRAACAALAAQRNLKIIGIFARLWLRDGKDRYIAHIPRVWGYLQRDLAHEALTPLRDWVDAHLPAPTDVNLSNLRASPPRQTPPEIGSKEESG